MYIEIDEEGIIPVYEQIVLQIQNGVLKGELETKAPLPSIRQLASDLAINHNTVAKAYQYLEMHGVIESHGRRGSFISGESKENIQENRQRHARKSMAKLFESLKDAGFEKDEINALAIDELEKSFVR